MQIDLEKQMREQMRWLILVCLDRGRPLGLNESVILSLLNDIQGQVTTHQLRRELDYLKDRKLVEVQDEQPMWRADITRYGVDLVEYNAAVEPGIARPQKYW